MEDPMVNVCDNYCLVVDKDAKTHTGEKKEFPAEGAGKTGHPHVDGWNYIQIYLPAQKINSKWIKDFKMKKKVLKLLEENMGSSLHDIGIRKQFLNRTPFAQG